MTIVATSIINTLRGQLVLVEVLLDITFASITFEEGLGAAYPDGVDIDLGQGGKLPQPRLHVQLAQPRLPEDHQELPE